MSGIHILQSIAEIVGVIAVTVMIYKHERRKWKNDL